MQQRTKMEETNLSSGNGRTGETEETSGNKKCVATEETSLRSGDGDWDRCDYGGKIAVDVSFR
ncbi:uncharacterized protein DS421_10g298020 [Arachis hypogaea]|nr:uncharacterized protein DS421_10g298020 [Arachis hypogaea]